MTTSAGSQMETKPDWRSPHLQLVGRTLIAGGFRILNVVRNPGYVFILTERQDEFGVPQRHAFNLADGGKLVEPQVRGAELAASRYEAFPVFIANEAAGRRAIEWERFISLFGGPVFSASPLDPQFRSQLVQLGLNSLPPELNGRPDDLFEAYVNVALEFVMWGKVVRYGQNRRFEARPDGLIMPSEFKALYDAKAAKDGYDVNTTSTRQFADYIEDFLSRYRPFITSFNAFLVVSTEFQQGHDALVDRSRDLQAKCGVPMAFLSADALADIVEILSENPAARGAIPWQRVVLDVVIDPGRVRKEVEAILKDRVIPPPSMPSSIGE